MLVSTRPLPKVEPQIPLQFVGVQNLIISQRPSQIKPIDTQYVYASEEDNCVSAMAILGD